MPALGARKHPCNPLSNLLGCVGPHSLPCRSNDVLNGATTASTYGVIPIGGYAGVGVTQVRADCRAGMGLAWVALDFFATCLPHRVMKLAACHPLGCLNP